MILECGHCGAPLDVKEGASTTRCRYCRTMNERERMRTIAADTPRDFRPPKVWVPPAHVPMRSAAPLAYQGTRAAGTLVLVITVLGMGVGVVGAIVAARTTRSGSTPFSGLGVGMTSQKLATVRLDQTAEGLARALSVKPSKTSVYTTFTDPRFEAVSFSWDEAHPEHPVGFYISARSGLAPDPRVAAAIGARLHGGLNDGNWHWAGGLNVNVSKDGGLNAHVDAESGHGKESLPNPRWKEKLGAAWKIVLEAAFNIPASLTPRDAQELLGAPHRFTDVARFDPATPIDNAAATVAARFPGSAVSTFIDLDAEIEVDHPLFRIASLSWENKKGGALHGVGLRGSSAFAAKREAFVQCLGGKIGAPRVNDTDYVNKKKNYSFEVGHTYLSVSESNVHYSGSGGAGIPAETFSKVMGAIDGCR